jgi:uncharacterized membrane protein
MSKGDVRLRPEGAPPSVEAFRGRDLILLARALHAEHRHAHRKRSLARLVAQLVAHVRPRE